MVSTVITDGSGESRTASATSQTSNITPGGATPTYGVGRAETCGLENLRQRTAAKGLSSRATELCLQARRPGTQLAYNGPWKKWSGWCGTREINPFRATVGNIADFLSEMFDRGLEYATMNSYRSAISAYHPVLDGHDVGKHPMIKTLLQGMFNQRPPKPRYGATWDVDIVLNHIRTKGENDKLSDKDLTLKVTMLMALSSAGRGSELHQLNPATVVDRGQSIEFHIEGLTKTKRPSRPHRTIKIGDYSQDSLLNVLACLRHYMTRTKPLRVTESQKTQLLISFIGPHKAVQKCTVARWLKMLMAEAGIDTSTYKAHSTRMASVSKASAQGLSIEQIMDRANWSKSSTFHRFYHREIQTMTDRYQDEVLSLK